MEITKHWRQILEANCVQPRQTPPERRIPSLADCYLTQPALLEISAKDIDISDIHEDEYQNLHINNAPVFAYLRIGKKPPETRRVHFTYCSTVRDMVGGKLFCTQNSDGLFEVDIEQHQTKKTVKYPLKPCLFCIGNYFGLTSYDDREEKNTIASHFNYSAIIHEIGVSLHRSIWQSKLYTYTNKSWTDISFETRAKANWTCERCGLFIGKENRSLLHTHHIAGDRHFNHAINYAVLCIRCHAEEPGHEHLKQFEQHKVFMRLLQSGKFKPPVCHQKG